MNVDRISSAVLAGGSLPARSQTDGTDTVQSLASAVRQLNNAATGDGVFNVIRDPATHRFVVVLRDKTSGDLIDQYPPEDILRMAAALSASPANSIGESDK